MKPPIGASVTLCVHGHESRGCALVKPQQHARDVDVECAGGGRAGEFVQRTLVARGAHPAPIADHVDVDAFAFGLADGRAACERPRGNREWYQRLTQALVMVGSAFSASRTAATAQLACEAAAIAPLESQPGKAQRVFGCQCLQRLARAALGTEGPVVPGRASLPPAHPYARRWPERHR